MILIRLEFLDQSLVLLRVEGHQQTKIINQDFGIVCNSASVTVQTFQESLLKLVSETEFELENAKGLCLVKRKHKNGLDREKEKILDILVKVTLIGFKRLEQHYPEHVKVHLVEK